MDLQAAQEARFCSGCEYSFAACAMLREQVCCPDCNHGKKAAGGE